MSVSSKPSVYVVGGDDMIEKMFYDEFYPVVNKQDKADIICFIGGADINPALYGERIGPKMRSTMVSISDDSRDITAWKLAGDGMDGRLKIGICRGGQFMNVMNGGKMYQHVSNHVGDHMMTDTLINPGNEIRINSFHHQQMIPHGTAEVLGYSMNQAGEFWSQDGKLSERPQYEAEILWYEKSRSLCFQAHPEYKSRHIPEKAHPCREHFFEILDIVR